MATSIIKSDANSVTLQITISFGRSMLDTEETIQSQLNEAGMLASAKALEQFDTDGKPD